MNTEKMTNNYPWYVDAMLSKYEQQMREFLMYKFNICLKLILMKFNYKEFDKYFFNSCRQTAVFGSLVLNKYFTDYTYKAYEAEFKDTLFGKPVTYQHCFIIATHKEINREILIDMARTTNPLVFEPITSTHFYPKVENYKDLEMISCFEIPYKDLLFSSVEEYMTGLTTMEFLTMLLETLEKYDSFDVNTKNSVTQTMYSLPIKKLEQFKLENNILDGGINGNRFINFEHPTEECST